MMGGIFLTPDRSVEPTAADFDEACVRVPRMERTTFTRTDLASSALEARHILTSNRLSGIVKAPMIRSANWMLLSSLVCDCQTGFEHPPNLQFCWFCPAIRGPRNLVTVEVLCIFRHRWLR